MTHRPEGRAGPRSSRSRAGRVRRWSAPRRPPTEEQPLCSPPGSPSCTMHGRTQYLGRPRRHGQVWLPRLRHADDVGFDPETTRNDGLAKARSRRRGVTSYRPYIRGEGRDRDGSPRPAGTGVFRRSRPRRKRFVVGRLEPGAAAVREPGGAPTWPCYLALMDDRYPAKDAHQSVHLEPTVPLVLLASAGWVSYGRMSGSSGRFRLLDVPSVGSPAAADSRTAFGTARIALRRLFASCPDEAPPVHAQLRA